MINWHIGLVRQSSRQVGEDKAQDGLVKTNEQDYLSRVGAELRLSGLLPENQ